MHGNEISVNKQFPASLPDINTWNAWTFMISTRSSFHFFFVSLQPNLEQEMIISMSCCICLYRHTMHVIVSHCFQWNNILIFLGSVCKAVYVFLCKHKTELIVCNKQYCLVLLTFVANCAICRLVTFSFRVLFVLSLISPCNFQVKSIDPNCLEIVFMTDCCI